MVTIDKKFNMATLTLLCREFNTKLGTVELLITTDAETPVSTTEEGTQEYNLFSIKAEGYQINLYECVPKFPVPHKTHTVERSIAWIVMLRQLSSHQVGLRITTKLTPVSKTTSWDADTGEGLNAILIGGNDAAVVSIGTEDSETLAHRAERDDWMPKRLHDLWGSNGKSWGSLVSYVDFGMRLDLPPLQKGEKIYYQSIVAEGVSRGDDISTNIMVDQTKENMLDLLHLM